MSKVKPQKQSDTFLKGHLLHTVHVVHVGTTHLDQCVLTVTIKPVPFGVKCAVLPIPKHFTHSRTCLVDTRPFSSSAGAVRHKIMFLFKSGNQDLISQ